LFFNNLLIQSFGGLFQQPNRAYLVMKTISCISAVISFLISGTALCQERISLPATIIAGEYFFKPNHVVIKVNEPVELRIKREPGVIPHNFVIKEPSVDIDLREPITTEVKIIRLVFKNTGKYKFYCDQKLLFFKSHREKGMEGIIEVIE